MEELIVNNFPKSGITESIKGIRTNLKFSSVSKKIQTILITSSIAGEGKSFVSANLAAVYAAAKEKVLLIDCDLRRGRQQKLFDMSKKSTLGLSNLLIDDEWKDNLTEYIKATKVKNLDILTTGSIPPNPSVLLESKKLEELINKLKKIYDVIIIDTPPVGVVTDALVMTRLSDVVIVVASAKKTTMELLENTKQALQSVNANIGGVVLNNIERANSKYYSDYY